VLYFPYTREKPLEAFRMDAIAPLIGFLLDRQHRYRVTTDGLRFDKDADARMYNQHIDARARTEEPLHSARQSADELSRQEPASVEHK
jgi:DNA polymerase II large subunit